MDTVTFRPSAARHPLSPREYEYRSGIMQWDARVWREEAPGGNATHSLLHCPTTRLPLTLVTTGLAPLAASMPPFQTLALP